MAFDLRISSLAELIAFIDFVNGTHPSEEELAEKLKGATDPLATALKENPDAQSDPKDAR